MLLYALGNVSQGMIAKLLGVSHVAVHKWVRAAGEDTPAPSATPSGNIVQIDEMWHFVDGKKTSFGSGGPSILWHGEPWPGSWVGVMTLPARRLLDKVGIDGHVFLTDDWEGFRRLIPEEQHSPART